MKIIADPCSAPLAHGLYGDEQGYLTRLESTHTVASSGTSTCGYLLWFPNYTGTTAGGNPANMFTWQSADPGILPSNTIAQPFGSQVSASDVTAAAVRDPASVFLNGDFADSARLLSACVKMSYTGKLMDTQGQIIPVSGLTLDQLFTSGENSCIDVNSIFLLSKDPGRLGVDTAEVVYNPVDPGMERFRSPEDAAVTLGVPGVSTSIHGTDAENFQPTCVGFAWRGIQANSVNQLIFQITKNIEWKAARNSGMPNKSRTIGNGVSKVGAAVAALDRASPNWWNRATKTVKSAISQISSAAFTGVLHAGASYMGAPEVLMLD